MKTLITIICLIPLIGMAQMYTWGAGVNPAWTSSNMSNQTLSWQPTINTVSTSGFVSGNWLRYANNQNTTYTSPTISLTGCATSSFISVTPNMEINLENGYDFLYFQYSTNNGTNWINLGTYTGNMGVINPTYIIPNTANRFRFVFTSDLTVNSYGNGANTFIYYADILGFVVTCPVFLPVELTSFTGTKGNNLNWTVDSEINCSHYTLERSTNGTEWEVISIVPATGSGYYTVKDETFEKVINYYRLSQTDSDGTENVYDELVSIDNRTKVKTVVSNTNLLGQTVDEHATGLIIVTFSDGSSEKQYR